MKVVSDKALRVSTVGGAAVVFEPGVPRVVGNVIGVLALQMGAKQLDAEPEVTVVEERPAVPRKGSTLVEVMNRLIDKADPDDFKSDGTPKAAAVNREAGRTVLTDERERAWEEALNL